MGSENGFDMYVFRAGKSAARADVRAAELGAQLRSLPAVVDGEKDRDQKVDALVAAGELEAGLADAGNREATFAAVAVDALARDLAGCGTGNGIESALANLSSICSATTVCTSAPEGFTYHGLHPDDYFDLAKTMALPASRAAVIGLRSIGTTLGAVVVAALEQRGMVAARTTVRPTGHPYRRETCFDRDQRRWLERELDLGACCLVVDEGPGLSGSSFLSTGDALLQLGWPPARIRFLCSRTVDPACLLAPEAARRWPLFESHVATRRRSFGEAAPLDGGRWRARWFDDEAAWPAAWTTMERPKYAAGSAFWKFEGLGPRGAASFARSALLAARGFGPAVERGTGGFAEFDVLPGRPLGPEQVSERVLRRLADYVSLRSTDFPGEPRPGDDLPSMVEVNLAHEHVAAPRLALPIARAVVPDGRMLPHEWIELGDGTMLKTDGANHGDDPFFPGPTDIAWDLASAIVEWRLDDGAASFLIDAYRRKSGDDPAARLNEWLIAYTVFRMAWCKMASAAMQGTNDGQRLSREYLRYRERALRGLGRSTAG